MERIRMGNRLIFLCCRSTRGDASRSGDASGQADHDSGEQQKPGEYRHDENQARAGTAPVWGFGRFPEPMKSRNGWIFCNRTENRHWCPSLKRGRRVGRNQSRELGKLVSYLRYKRCLPSRPSLERQVAVTREVRLFNKWRGR